MDELLDAIPTNVTVDLIEAFALPLPIRVICSLLGVPAVDHYRFAEWTRPFVTEATPEDVPVRCRRGRRIPNDTDRE